jgi:hypothetical protein
LSGFNVFFVFFDGFGVVGSDVYRPLFRQLAVKSDGLLSTVLTFLAFQVPAVRILISSRQFLGDPPLNPVEDAADLSKLIADSALQIVQDFHVRCDVGFVKKPIESLDEVGYFMKFGHRVS